MEEKYAGLNQLLLSGFADWNNLCRVITHEVVCAAHFCGTTQLSQAIGDEARAVPSRKSGTATFERDSVICKHIGSKSSKIRR